MWLKFLYCERGKGHMLEGHGMVRGLCLVGILGTLIAGAGCGQMKKLRQENQQLNESISSMQQENAELSSKASRYESEINRLENSRRDLEAKLKGTDRKSTRLNSSH